MNELLASPLVQSVVAAVVCKLADCLVGKAVEHLLEKTPETKIQKKKVRRGPRK